MKKPLLDVIFASEKRKMVLLHLKDGAKEMKELIKLLDTSRAALLPQMKILTEHYLIDHFRDSYNLTTTGKLIVDRMTPVLDIMELLDVDIDYWGSHDMSFIPPHLFSRLPELTPFKVISNISTTQIYEPDYNVIEKAKHSKIQNSVTTFLFPTFASVLADFNERGVKMRLIVSPELLSKIRNEKGEVRELLNNEHHEVFLYPKEMHFMSFGTNDSCFMMRTLSNTGNYDQKYIMACNPSAVQWGKELFDYYLKDSTPITEL